MLKLVKLGIKEENHWLYRNEEDKKNAMNNWMQTK